MAYSGEDGGREGKCGNPMHRESLAETAACCAAVLDTLSYLQPEGLEGGAFEKGLRLILLTMRDALRSHPEVAGVDGQQVH